MFADELKDLQAELIARLLYNAIETMDELHRFMRIHVFALLDFMTLTKHLQTYLTCTRIPWIPLEDKVSVRLINDIVLSEESEIDRDGSPASHLALYLKEMREVRASTRMFDTFLRHLKQGGWCLTCSDELSSEPFSSSMGSSHDHYILSTTVGRWARRIPGSGARTRLRTGVRELESYDVRWQSRAARKK